MGYDIDIYPTKRVELTGRDLHDLTREAYRSLEIITNDLSQIEWVRMSSGTIVDEEHLIQNGNCMFLTTSPRNDIVFCISEIPDDGSKPSIWLQSMCERYGRNNPQIDVQMLIQSVTEANSTLEVTCGRPLTQENMEYFITFTLLLATRFAGMIQFSEDYYKIPSGLYTVEQFSELIPAWLK